MKKIFLLLLIIIEIPIFADGSVKLTKDKYFMLPELVLFGEEQFYLFPLPLRKQTSLLSGEDIPANINDYNSISYVSHMKIEEYPNIYTPVIPEKIVLINY